MFDDSQLLSRYASGIGPDEAFAELVRRYLNLVFSTARRMLGNEGHRAEDIAQEVFLHLARQAAHLSPETVLSSWLHRDTYYTTLELLRADRRRRIREGKAMDDFEGAGPEVNWDRLSPILDHALQQLADTDRKTILWRFFEDRPLQEVGKQLGLSESGASRRVGKTSRRPGSPRNYHDRKCLGFSDDAIGDSSGTTPVGLGDCRGFLRHDYRLDHETF